MNKSPIEIIQSISFKEQLEDSIMKAVQKVGIQVNKEELQRLIDKATPKKIKETDSFFLCPSCNQILETKYEGMCIDCLHKRHYCPNCGQKLDWSENETKRF